MIIAPGRSRRPGAFLVPDDEPTQEELDECPFCEGREDRTPPEVLALPHREPADSPGWRVRVVPNLYPAFEHQEVVVHTPRHARSFAELADDDVELVAGAWRQRMAVAEAEGFAYVHAFINEGRDAGASRLHTHSQLVWMREAPPAVAAESNALGDLVASVHGRDPARKLHVDLIDGVAAFCPPASRVPYEVLIAAVTTSNDDGFGEDLAPALLVLRNVARRLRTVEGAVAWNAWLHTGAQWHIEVVPRLTVLAGIELGAGIYVNPLPPEEAAARLRAAEI